MIFRSLFTFQYVEETGYHYFALLILKNGLAIWFLHSQKFVP